MKIQPTHEQITYARYLKKQYGKDVAIAYLKLVTRPDYRNGKSATKADKGVAVSLSHRSRS